MKLLTTQEQKMQEAQEKREQYVSDLYKQIKAENASVEKRRTMASKGRTLNSRYAEELERSHARILNQGKYDYHDLAYSRTITHPEVQTHTIEYGH